MAWASLTVDVPALFSEVTQALMFETGAAGLELRDTPTGLMPGVRAPASGEVIVLGYFAAPADARKAMERIKAEVRSARCAVDQVVEQDWSVSWRDHVRAVTVGRLWVGPPWQKPRKGKVPLFIEPKMAFGTGDHPTTSLCLAAVDQFLATHPRASVLDVGTGTGVLALAARKLGAARVVGVDNDPVAVELARECAAENKVRGVTLSTAPLADIRGRFDLVVANILANTLIELAPLLVKRTRLRLVLAGVLAHQAEEVSAPFQDLGLVRGRLRVKGEWVRLDFSVPVAAAGRGTRRGVRRTAGSRLPLW